MCSQFYPDAICHPNWGTFCCLAPVDIWLIRFYSLSATRGKSLARGGHTVSPPSALIHLSLSIRLSISTHLAAYLFFNSSPGKAEGPEFLLLHFKVLPEIMKEKKTNVFMLIIWYSMLRNVYSCNPLWQWFNFFIEMWQCNLKTTAVGMAGIILVHKQWKAVWHFSRHSGFLLLQLHSVWCGPMFIADEIWELWENAITYADFMMWYLVYSIKHVVYKHVLNIANL